MEPTATGLGAQGPIEAGQRFWAGAGATNGGRNAYVSNMYNNWNPRVNSPNNYLNQDYAYVGGASASSNPAQWPAEGLWDDAGSCSRFAGVIEYEGAAVIP